MLCVCGAQTPISNGYYPSDPLIKLGCTLAGADTAVALTDLSDVMRPPDERSNPRSMDRSGSTTAA